MAKSKSRMAGLLNKAGRKATGSSKKTTPTVTLPEARATQIGQWHEAKRTETTATAERKDIEAQLRVEIDDARKAASLRDGKVYASVKVQAGKERLTFVQTGRFTKMAADEAEDTLQTIFGDGFDTLFRTQPNITLSDDMTSDEANAVGEALIEALGDRFSNVVKVDPVIIPTEALVTKMLLDTDITEKVKKAQDEGLLTLYSPSFKK